MRLFTIILGGQFRLYFMENCGSITLAAPQLYRQEIGVFGEPRLRIGLSLLVSTRRRCLSLVLVLESGASTAQMAGSTGKNLRVVVVVDKYYNVAR